MARLFTNLPTASDTSSNRVFKNLPISGSSAQPQQSTLGKVASGIGALEMGTGLINPVSTGLGKFIADQSGITGIAKGIGAATKIAGQAITGKPITAPSVSPEQFSGSVGKAALTGASFLIPGLTEGSLAAQIAKQAAIGAGFGTTQALEEGRSAKDVAKQAAIGAPIGASVPIVSRLFEAGITKLAPTVSKWLEKSSLRLTPVQRSNLTNKLDGISEWLSGKKIIGSPLGRYEKAQGIVNGYEDSLQKVLDDNENVTVSKNFLKQQLDKAKELAMKDSSDAGVIGKQYEAAKTNLDFQYGNNDEIPINRLNNLKRSTYDNAYNKAGDKVLDDVEHDIGDVYRKSIERASNNANIKVNGKPIGEFNKEYGTGIQAKKLLKIASGRNQLGLFGRFITGLIGGGIAAALKLGPVGEAVGFGTEEIAKEFATPVRSIGSAALRTGSEFASSPSGQAVGRLAKKAILPTVFRKNTP